MTCNNTIIDISGLKQLRCPKCIMANNKMVIKPIDKDGWIEENDKDLVKIDENGNRFATILNKDYRINLRPVKKDE